MLENDFNNLIGNRIGSDNPLTSHLWPFAASLIEEGYTAATVQKKLRSIAGFGQWLRRGSSSTVDIADVNAQTVETFIKDRRRAGIHRFNRKTFSQFLDHLHSRGIIANPKLIGEPSPLADVRNRYEGYLRSERGLAPATISNYHISFSSGRFSLGVSERDHFFSGN